MIMHDAIIVERGQSSLRENSTLVVDNPEDTEDENFGPGTDYTALHPPTPFYFIKPG